MIERIKLTPLIVFAVIPGIITYYLFASGHIVFPLAWTLLYITFYYLLYRLTFNKNWGMMFLTWFLLSILFYIFITLFLFIWIYIIQGYTESEVSLLITFGIISFVAPTSLAVVILGGIVRRFPQILKITNKLKPNITLLSQSKTIKFLKKKLSTKLKLIPSLVVVILWSLFFAKVFNGTPISCPIACIPHLPDCGCSGYSFYGIEYLIPAFIFAVFAYIIASIFEKLYKRIKILIQDKLTK